MRRTHRWRGFGRALGSVVAAAMVVTITAQAGSAMDRSTSVPVDEAPTQAFDAPPSQTTDAPSSNKGAAAEALGALLDGSTFNLATIDGLIADPGATDPLPSAGSAIVSIVGDQGSPAGVSSLNLQTGTFVAFDVEGATVESGDTEVSTASGGAESEAYVTQATSTGAQMMYVMQDGSASSDFTIDTDIPVGTTWVAQPDGSLYLMDDVSAAAPLVVVDAPWAIDAAGTSLPTTFEVTADGFVQHVDTTGAQFPVVADHTACSAAGRLACCPRPRGGGASRAWH